MRYTEDLYDNEHESKIVMVQMMIIMTAVVAIIVGVVILMNKPDLVVKRTSISHSTASLNDRNTNLEGYISGSTLTSDQLDIWTLPDVAIKESDSYGRLMDGVVINETTGELVSEGKVNDVQEENIEGVEGTLSEQQIVITKADGSTMLIDIDTELEQNKYLLSGFSNKDYLMKYFENGVKLSKVGVDVNARLGEVDFFRLKAIGCDYAMIRIGCRGYSSGKIVIDDKYKVNMDAASKAGLGVGVYFLSQATNKEEVLEEVDTVIEAIGDYKITYPVMLKYEATTDDVSRIDELDIDERTRLIKIFLSEIKEAGYSPILYGTKEWLLTQVDLGNLSDYDICFSEDGQLPDFPYKYKMWEYNSTGEIGGIQKPTKLSIYMQSDN